jgi:hypothetical protein
VDRLHGLDPEINETGGGANFTQGEFNTQPPLRLLHGSLQLHLLSGGAMMNTIARLPHAGLVVLLPVLALAACDLDDLLEVEEPTFATPESLRNEAGLPVLYAAALGDFPGGVQRIGRRCVSYGVLADQ